MLHELYTTTGDPAGQAAILERQAETVAGDARAALLTQAGELLRPADPDRAILLWERAIGASAATTDRVLPLLIDAYTQRENWQPLLTTWNRVISATKDPKVAANAFHQKGLILLDKLSLPEKAEQHFQRALGADPNHAPALERIAAMQEASGRVAEARATLTKLVALATDGGADDLLVHLAALDRDAGDDASAVAHLETVAVRNPARADVHAQLIELHAKSGDAPGQSQALRNAIGAAPESEKPALRRQLGAALDAANDEEGALTEWRLSLKGEPDNIESRIAIASILGRKPATRPEAIAAHVSVLKLDPAATVSLLWLAKTWEELKHHDKVFCLLSVLSWIGVATPEQEIYWKEQIARAPRKASQPLSPEDRRGLLAHPDARTPIGDLVTILGSSIYAGLPFDVPAGATKVSPGEKHPLRARLDGLRMMLDGPEIELYVSREPGAEAKVFACDPMVIVVGMGFPALPPAVQDFLLGRAAFRATTGWPPAWRSEHEVRADVWTAAAALDFTDPPMGSDPKRIKAIAKAVSRKQKKDAADLFAAWVAKPQSFDVGTFIAAARRTADRAGLLACIDVARAVDALSFVEPDVQALRADESANEPFWRRAAVTPAVRELLTFATSDELFLLRKKLGLSIA